MNYLTLGGGTQNNEPKETRPSGNTPTSQTKTILLFMSLAFSWDFNRYSEVISTKIMLEEMMNKKNLSRAQSLRSRSLPAPPPQEKQQLPSHPKAAEKNAPTKVEVTSKPPKVKTTSVNPTTPNLKPVPPKVEKSAQLVAPASPKIKKKIHKFSEVKKENPGRVPKVSLLQTAEISKCRLTDKERKKMRQRLLLRVVREWDTVMQIRRDRRELRTLQ